MDQKYGRINELIKKSDKIKWKINWFDQFVRCVIFILFKIKQGNKITYNLTNKTIVKIIRIYTKKHKQNQFNWSMALINGLRTQHDLWECWCIIINNIHIQRHILYIQRSFNSLASALACLNCVKLAGNAYFHTSDNNNNNKILQPEREAGKNRSLLRIHWHDGSVCID